MTSMVEATDMESIDSLKCIYAAQMNGTQLVTKTFYETTPYTRTGIFYFFAIVYTENQKAKNKVWLCQSQNSINKNLNYSSFLNFSYWGSFFLWIQRHGLVVRSTCSCRELKFSSQYIHICTCCWLEVDFEIKMSLQIYNGH